MSVEIEKMSYYNFLVFIFEQNWLNFIGILMLQFYEGFSDFVDIQQF